MNKKHSENRGLHRHHDRQRKGRVDGRNDSAIERFGSFCHNDAVGRFTSSAIFGCIMRRNALLLRMKKGEPPSMIRDGKVIRCKSENHVPLLAVSEEPRFHPMTLRRRWAPRAPGEVRNKFFNPMSQAKRTQARHRVTDCVSHVSRHRETGRIRFEDGFNLSKKASLVNLPPPSLPLLPTHTVVVVEQPVVEPKEKTPDDTRGELRRRISRSSSYRRKVPETRRKQTNWQARCFLHMFLKIQIGCNLSETTGAPCRNHPEARGDRAHHPKFFGNVFTSDHKVLGQENESRLQHRYAGRGAGPFFFLDPMLPNETKTLRRKRWLVCNKSCRQVKNLVFFTQVILWSFYGLVNTFVGLTPSQLHTRSETNGVAENAVRSAKKCTFWFSRVFRKRGVQKQRNASVCCKTYKTNWQTEGHRMWNSILMVR